MTLGKKARAAETTVGRAVDTLVTRFLGATEHQPLEIVHNVLEDLERQVQPAGRGKWVFPFNRVTIDLLAPTRDARARLSGIVGTSEALRDRILAKLGPACHVDALDVRIRFRGTKGEHWSHPEYHLELERVAVPAVVVEPAVEKPASIDLVLTAGTADRRRFTFGTERIDIGRGADVLDSRQRLLRRNQIAFSDDGEAANQTVSRRHAHVLYRAASREYRVFDDGSARGTNIFRKGVTIPVPSGSRGVALRTDDELILGQARLRVRIGDAVPR